MSGADKKLRRQQRKITQAAAREMEAKMINEINTRAREIIKPRPKWMPGWLYRRLANLIINKGPI